MNRTDGVVPAKVVDVNDPENLGRVKVTYEWLSDDNESQWAPIATLMAGTGNGSCMMPEVGDIALIAFEHGDFDFPCIMGFQWNQARKPPNDDINPAVRRLQTVSGHILEFDDNSKQERILIKTQGNHEIELKDTAPAQIKIKTQGGQTVTLDDGKANITIQTAGNQKISIDPTGITISASTGTVNISAPTGTVNISAPLTTFSGVVQIPTLVAQSVVGAAYTPAPGNLLGL